MRIVIMLVALIALSVAFGWLMYTTYNAVTTNDLHVKYAECQSNGGVLMSQNNWLWRSSVIDNSHQCYEPMEKPVIQVSR